MKEYNRQTKKYEEKSTEQIGDLKKRELCRGKKPHEWLFVIPDYSRSHKNDDLPQIVVEFFYYKMKLLDEYRKNLQQEFDEVGINFRFGSHFIEKHKHRRCSVCGKQDYI